MFNMEDEAKDKEAENAPPAEGEPALTPVGKARVFHRRKGARLFHRGKGACLYVT